MNRRRIATKWIDARVAAPLAILAVALFVWQVALPSATHLTNGFSAYYTAARLVGEGADAARFYDDTWFRDQTIRFGFASAQDIYNISPAAALLFGPFTGLTPVAAKEAWTGLNLIFSGAALLILARMCHWTRSECAIAVTLVTLFQPMREEIRLGQAYAFLLLLEALLAWAYVERRGGLAGGVLGFMLSAKAAGLALPMLFVSRRDLRALIGLGVAALAVVVGTLPWLGWTAWATYASLVVSFGAHPEIAVTAYQSIPGMFLHLFRFDTIWNRSPMLDVPALAVGLIVLAETAIVASTFWATARADLTVRPTRALALAAWVIVSIVASPASADYHYTLLIVPIALLVAASGRIGQSRRLIGALAIGAFLVAAPLPYKSPNLAIAGWSILAYPKLYGGLILWGITLATLRAAAYLPGVVWSASDPPMSRRSS